MHSNDPKDTLLVLQEESYKSYRSLMVLRWLMRPTLLTTKEATDLCQCYSCKEIGRIAKHCIMRLYNYCKKKYHIINAHPQNWSVAAFHDTVYSTFLPTSSTQPCNQGSLSNITHEQVLFLIVSALFALGIQGKRTSSSTLVNCFGNFNSLDLQSNNFTWCS